MSENDYIYLDYAAATPVDARVFEAMKPFFTEQFFNPSAPYLPAKHVRKIYEDYKDRVSYQTFQAILWGRSYSTLPIYKKKEKKWINI